MRVLFTTFAARSHLFAQVTMASAVRTAGHDVVVASQPDLCDDIQNAGLTAVAVGPPLHLEERMRDAGASLGEDGNMGGLAMSGTHADTATWSRSLGCMTAMSAFVFQNECPEPMVDDLVEFARFWRPDLVVWDPLTFAGAVAARVCGAAHARLLFGPDQVAMERVRFRELLARQPAERFDDPLAEWLGWTLGRHGAEAAGVDDELVLGQWTIDPLPTSLRVPVPGVQYVPVRFVPYNGRSLVPDWIRTPPDRPRVCVTLGQSLGETSGGGAVAAGDLMAAVAGLDVEVVATLAPELVEGLGALPANVRAIDFVPLDALLPSCSAIVHHGGSGTFMTALWHAVPQLVVPDLLWDSLEKSYALVRCGAGRYATGVDALRPDALRESIRAVAEDPSHAAAAEQVRREMLGTPTPNDLVPALERLADGTHRTAVAA